jgi:predicted metallopeptidase
MNTGPKEKSLKQLFVGKCWEYLNDNFHKFTETNKIKIALELCKKDIPTEISGSLEGVGTQIHITKVTNNLTEAELLDFIRSRKGVGQPV